MPSNSIKIFNVNFSAISMLINWIFFISERIVDIIGKEKSIEFYKKTKEIEEDGGLLIMNGSRRRTPGGVYFYLVKNDEHIPQEQIREIFSLDKKEANHTKKKINSARLREKSNQLMKSLESK